GASDGKYLDGKYECGQSPASAKNPVSSLAGRMLLISHAPPRPLLGSSLLLLDALRSPSRESGGTRNQWGNFVLLRSCPPHRAVIATSVSAAAVLILCGLPTAYALPPDPSDQR